MSRVRLYAGFTKVEENDDGTLYVEGVASSEARDADGEQILSSAIKSAIPEYMRYGGTGPLREMHQLKAAGRTLTADVDGEGKTWIGAKVVDPLAVTKVKEGVYVGFSVGGKVLKRSPEDPTVIEEMSLTEISLVDRPANPDAVISLWKADAMPEKTNAEPRPFVKLASLVEKFRKGKIQVDDAERQALEIAKGGKARVAAKRDEIKKGMWQVARAAELFDGLQTLEDSCEWEAEVEGDASPVPGLLVEAMRSFAAAMRALLDEELSEALEDEGEGDAGVELVARASSLAKRAGEAAKRLAEAMKMDPVKKELTKGGGHAVLSDDHKDDLAEIHGHVADAHKRIGKVHGALRDVKDGAHKDAVDAVKDDVAECHKRIGKARKVLDAMGYKDAAASDDVSDDPVRKAEQEPARPEPKTDLERMVAQVDAAMKDRLSKAQADLEASRKAQEAGHQALQQALQVREQIEKRSKENDEQAQMVAELISDMEKRYGEQIEKVNGEAEAIRKVADQAVAAAKQANETNEKLVAELAKRPKGALRAIPIEKAADNGTKNAGPQSDEDLQKVAGDLARPDAEREAARLELVKRVQKRPVQTR